MPQTDLMLFTLHSGQDFGERVSQYLDIPLSDHEEREFEDGEHKIRPLVSVRQRDVFVVQSLYSDPAQTVNDKLCRLLFFLGALRDASAARITAVVPYLCYARKDRKTKPRDPVTTRYIASLFEAVGVDRVVTLDVHNLAAFQNAFRQPTDHLESMKLFVEHLGPLLGGTELAVVSPDVGGTKRARAFCDALQRHLSQPIPLGFVEKQRSEGVVSGEAVVGDVEGRTVILLDDLISSGTTLARAAKACRAEGAARVFAAATHGLFVGEAEHVLSDPAVEGIFVTNSVSVQPYRLSQEFSERKLTVIDAAPLCGEAIRRIHEGGSLVDLLEV